MYRDHPQARVEQPLDQQPVGALDRHQPDAELDQPPAQRPDATLVVTEAPTLNDPPLAVDHADGVLLAGPINAGEAFLHDYLLGTPLTCVGGEVPWRVLTDGALTARLPVATRGTSTERREALVSCWPSTRASAGGALPASADTKEDDQ
jgi:hypothetical protein